MRKPNFFIVGHPRSGTSSLHRYLQQHPDVFMTPIKEPNFFSTDFRSESDAFHKKSLYFPFRTEEQYLGLYKKWNEEKAAGEASATYLCSKVTAAQIYRFNPGSKIIMMFREPVDFLYSFHSAAQFALGEHIQDFETALAAEKRRREGHGFSKRTITPSWLFYTEFVKYSEQIKRFLSFFDRNQIKILIFDDFKSNTEKSYLGVLEFLEVAVGLPPSFDVVNPNKELKWPLLKKYTLDSPYFRKALRKMLSNEAYAGLKNFYKSRLTTYKPRQPLDDRLRRRTMAIFKPEVEKLSALIDRNLLTLWGYDDI
jgi:hypothetical protein